MKVLLSAVGLAKAGPERDLFEQYRARLNWPFDLREVDDKKPMTGPERMRREGRLLLDTVPPGAVVVVLDERGKTLDSEALAARLGQWRDQSVPTIAFLIGGADGHGADVVARADLLLSLGAMTWPHMLVRALIAEQLYRCDCILSGHPYHRGRARNFDD